MHKQEYKVRIVEYTTFTVSAENKEEAEKIAVNETIWADHFDCFTIDIEGSEDD